jgi:phospholipid/cholesterol/gamma-HCH transport system substrate-binding protein
MKVRNEIKAGLFVVASLLVVGFLIVIMGRERQIFASQVEYYTEFNDVKGLAAGAPVRLGGIPIGRVAKVGFSQDLLDFKVHVSLLINEDYLDRIRTDSGVSIETAGLLGDRFISIAPGSATKSLPPKSHLQSSEIADIAQILSRAQAAVENTTQISERVNKALEGLTPEALANFGEAASSVSAILSAVRTENGFVHRLIYSEKEGAKLVDGLSKASKDVSDLVAEVKTGKGVLNALIYAPGGDNTVTQVSAMAQNIAKASGQLADVIAAAKNGNGLLHDLVYTQVEPGAVKKKFEEVLASFSETANNVRIATEALAKGTGTLGALLVDPQLYDNLVEVTDGAKRSFLLRQAIRSSLKQ